MQLNCDSGLVMASKRKGEVFIYGRYAFLRISQNSSNGEAIWTCQLSLVANIRVKTVGPRGNKVLS